MASKVIARPFLWRTMEGEVLTLEEMDTKHVFNSMKMIFNHLAEQFNATPIWFNHQYGDYQRGAVANPSGLAYLVLFFIAEIERRGDLLARYREPYAAICGQVFGQMKLKRIAAAVEEIDNG